MTDLRHSSHVVQIIADVYHGLDRNSAFLAKLFKCRGLVAQSLDRLNLQLSGPSRYHRVCFRGHNDNGDSSTPKGANRHAVGPIAEDGFLSVVQDQHTVVGQNAVKVKDNETRFQCTSAPVSGL